MNFGHTRLNRSSIMAISRRLGLDKNLSDEILGCTGFVLLPDLKLKGDNLLAYSTRPELLDPVHGVGRETRILVGNNSNFSKALKTFSVEDPSLVFWSLVQIVNTRPKTFPRSVVARSARVEKGAYVSPRGVRIGANAVVGANAVLLSGVTVGCDSQVGPNCVIGGDGFMVKDTVSGKTRITHDAGVFVGDNVTIGALTNIDAGLFGDTTRIENGAKLDSGVHIAHSSVVGENVVLAAGTKLGGWVNLGRDVFSGLNVVIAPRTEIGESSYIGAHAFIARSVPANSKFGARTAIPLRDV